jgi:diaminopimelate epimerase
MCGNGARCFAKFVVDRGLVARDATTMVADTLGGLRPIAFSREGDGTLALAPVDMGAPVVDARRVPTPGESAEVVDEPILTPEGVVNVTAVSMGNPHAIIWVDDPDTAPVEDVGPFVETHDRFPQRTNVEFAQVVDRSTIRLRVWERGCGETLACGTGACATVVAAIRAGLTDTEVTVELPGGDLTIAWTGEGSVMLTGSATTVFAGSIGLEDV